MQGKLGPGRQARIAICGVVAKPSSAPRCREPEEEMLPPPLGGGVMSRPSPLGIAARSSTGSPPAMPFAPSAAEQVTAPAATPPRALQSIVDHDLATRALTCTCADPTFTPRSARRNNRRL